MDGRSRGIDISHNDDNGNLLDWSSIASLGIDFAVAKASQGVGFQDPQFRNNWQGIKAAGLIRGAYHMIGFVDPASNPSWQDVVHRQIDRFLGIVGPLQSGDLPPALDIENLDSKAGWSNLIQHNRSTAVAVVREFITYTTAQLNGVLPILYTGSFWWSDLGDPDPGSMPFSAYPLWFAQYPYMPLPPGSNREASSFADYASFLNGKQPTHIPKVWGGPGSPSWAIWQFTEEGTPPGHMSGSLDLDVFHGTRADLMQLCVK
jgi:lysozyme